MQGIFAGFGVKRRALAGLAAAAVVAAALSGVLLMRRGRHGTGPVAVDGGVALGRFGIAGRAEGRYALRAVRDGQAAYLDGVMVTVGDAGAGVVTVELQPATTLSGRLRERGGRPVAGGEVTVSEADGAPLPRSATTDNEGNFRFTAVLPGAYVVTARAEGYYPSEPRPVRVGKTPQTVDVRLDPGATIEG